MGLAQKDKEKDMTNKLDEIRGIQKKINALMNKYDFAKMQKDIDGKAETVRP